MGGRGRLRGWERGWQVRGGSKREEKVGERVCWRAGTRGGGGGKERGWQVRGGLGLGRREKVGRPNKGVSEGRGVGWG